MFVALSLLWFVLGFSAAVAWTLRTDLSVDKSLPISQLVSIVIERIKSGNLPLPGQSPAIARRLLEDTGPNAGLMTKQEIESIFDHSSWQRLAYEDFKAKIMARETGLRTFPCIYATMGYRQDGHMYLFLKSSNPSEPQNIRLIGPALARYLEVARSLGPNTSMVIIAAPPDSDSDSDSTETSTPKSIDDYNNDFWNLLRGLRIHDPEPWPATIPAATQDEKWTFCYNGQPIFPVLLTPAHTRRFSRHSSVPIIALQPKWILDALLGTPEKRESATGKVRKLLREYDTVDVSPDLTGYGEVGTSEVRQLCLKDQNETVGCPFDDFDR